MTYMCYESVILQLQGNNQLKMCIYVQNQNKYNNFSFM